ncbi:hydrolase [Streptomyces griseocarneus]|uniref:hydrolase n=1 Tax=Streptomyces griseocarneus TaxID=51201 RepID=UPI00167CD5FE|nr:hydrolase [Streptomyces griseocarneus]MBZ6478147.1 hydrolase [Streptomyces griseocarneus]GHG84123.1 hydrolase [Streptomyces griseocarneus]
MRTQAPEGTGLTARSVELAELARHRAQDAEEQRRLTPDVVEHMLRAGFARHFTPVAQGGEDGTFEELTRALITVAEADTATAWCASIAASLSRMAAYLPVEAHADVWREGPDTFLVGTLSPLGKATPVPGGWRVSGSWAYISGIDYSHWALVCAVVPRGEGEPQDGPPPARIFALPRGAYSVKDTWTSSGMRGTGSNTLIADDVFVPETHSYSRRRLFDGEPLGSAAACHTVPLQAANGLSFAVPAVGAARGALALWTTETAARLARGAGRPGMPGPVRTTYEATLSRSAAEIDSAQLLLERASRVADKGAAVTAGETARNLRDCSLTAEMTVSAVNRLFSTAGTSGQATDSPLQRIWRDVNSISTHVLLAFDPAAALYASHTFGS